MNFDDKKQEKKVYEAPAVIYDGSLSTRAGSPIPGPVDGVDPTDLFN